MTESERLFEQVYRTYGPSLYRFCLLQMKNPADAEDVLQEVFCKRLYRAPSFSSPDHERRWLFRVALNQCRDAWKRSSRSDLPLEAASAAVTPEELGLLDQVAALPEPQRTVLHLHYYEGYSPPGARAAPGGDGAHGENAAEAGPGRPAVNMGGTLMNRYHDAMEHCAPPPELEARLREAVLSAEPEPHLHPAVFRPRGFFRKALLVAVVLAAALTLSVGAAVLVNWDTIFSDRFGPEGAETPMAEKAFQPVHVSSVCDDVTLTIREALVDEKSIYLILDYQLPDTVDPETVEMAYNSREDTQKDDIELPAITYYATDDVAWEDLKAAEQDTWTTIRISIYPYILRKTGLWKAGKHTEPHWQNQWLRRPGRGGLRPSNQYALLSLLYHRR